MSKTRRPLRSQAYDWIMSPGQVDTSEPFAPVPGFNRAGAVQEHGVLPDRSSYGPRRQPSARAEESRHHAMSASSVCGAKLSVTAASPRSSERSRRGPGSRAAGEVDGPVVQDVHSHLMIALDASWWNDAEPSRVTAPPRLPDSGQPSHTHRAPDSVIVGSALEARSCGKYCCSRTRPRSPPVAVRRLPVDERPANRRCDVPVAHLSRVPVEVAPRA